jgi:hypothetical protein
MMKKLILAFAVVAALASCNSKIDESQATGVTPTTAATESLEALSAESDSTKFACTCEHKCTTKEECTKNCGPECNMASK